MKKITKIILIVILIILIIIPLSLSMRTLIKKPACFFNGGVWRMFSNGCGDSCIKERETPDNPIMCTMAFQESCDCGPLRCWNHEKQRCELN